MDQSVLETALQTALENKELSLTYQPICHLKTGEMVLMEVLVRWRHPEMGPISPNIFIPLAEKNGAIHLLGNWIFESACQQIKKWLDSGHRPFKLAINISPQQILHHGFLPFIQKTLAEHGVSTQYIELELTETAMMPQTVYADTILLKLRDLGFELVIDDFGTGFSSLSHLKNLPVQAIKIDKSFLENVERDQKSAVIIHSLIRLGAELGMNVIAEGIETKEQLDFLVQHQCLLGQGHYLSGPLTAEEMSARLNVVE